MTKIIKKFLSWTLVGAILAGATVAGAFALSKAFHSEEMSFADTAGGMQLSGLQENHGISLSARKAAPVAVAQENSVELTAEISPEWAADKRVDWSVAWKSGADGQWGNGKTITDYVAVTPTSDGALHATVTCLRAFGEPVLVTVRSRVNANASATCRFEYQQKFIGTATELKNMNPSHQVELSTPAEGGTITSDLPDPAQKDLLFTNYRYTIVKSEAYTIPLGGSASIEYYLKPTPDFAARLEMETTMAGYELEPADDWILLDSVYSVDLGTEGTTMGWSTHLSSGNAYGIPFYLNKLCGGLSGTVDTFTDQYPGFLDAVNGINNSPAEYSDHVCFEIKIVTKIGQETYESVTQVKLNAANVTVQSIEFAENTYNF